MKKMLTFLMMLLLAIGLFAGCLTDSGDDGGDDGDNGGNGGGSGGTAAEYFPFTSPGTWVFEETETETGQPTVNSTSTVYTNGTKTIDGKTYVALTDDSEIDDMYFRVENNIIYMYDPDMDAIPKESPAKMAMIAQIASMDYPWVDFNKSAGGTWTILDNSGSYEGYSWSSNMTGKYIGTETVTVPAGTYSNCMKFEMTYTGSYSGNGESSSETDIETFWFAKNVGPVKILSVYKEDGVTYSTATSSLKSYAKESIGDGDGGGDGGDGGDGTPGTHAYFPLKDNAHWSFAEIEKDLTDNSQESSVNTMTVDGTADRNGKTYWVVTHEDGYIDYMRIEGGILYTFPDDDILSAKEAMPAALKQAVMEDEPLSSEVPVLNLDAGSGATWTILDYDMSQAGVAASIFWSGKYIGTETVTVPAGTFSNCRKYEMTMSITSSFGDFNSSFTTTTNLWLAQNVGLVKTQDKEWEGDEQVFEANEQLTAYAIP